MRRPRQSASAVLSVWVNAGLCGFPGALNAIFVVKKVFAERDLLPLETGNADTPGSAA